MIKGKSIFSRRKKEEVVPDNVMLEILMDFKKPGIVEFLKRGNVYCKDILDSVGDLMINVVYSIEDTGEGSTKKRVLIVDTGSGKFSDRDYVKEVSECIQVCLDDGVPVTVCYTSITFYTELKKIKKKNGLKTELDISKYVNTLSILKVLEKYNEKYIYDGAVEEVYNSDINYTGDINEYERVEVEFKGVSECIDMEEESLKKYSIKI